MLAFPLSLSLSLTLTQIITKPKKLYLSTLNTVGKILILI